MRFRTVSRRSWLMGLMAACSVAVLGCGEGSSNGQVGTQEDLAIDEIARIFRFYRKGKKPAPKGLKDVIGLEQGYPAAIESLKKGDFVVIWGAGLSDAPDAASKVLVYQKSAPNQGGEVLMQDGTTKKMTADEFKAAPKATKS